MAIGDPINAGIGSYDPSVNYFAQPQRRGAGLLSPSDLNLPTAPGQSQMDALNAVRERLGMKPLDQGLGSQFSIAPTGMTKGQAKQQQMTVGDYDIGRKLAALDRPNIMTQVTSALQDDPGDVFDGSIGDFDITADPFDIETYESTVRDPNLDVDIGAAGLGVEPPAGAEEPTTSTTTTGSKRPDESEAEFNARIEREERGIFDGTSTTSTAAGGGTTTGGKSRAGSGSIDLMKSALDSYNDAIGRAPSGAKSMADYKKEFSEATGIDISGDPDNKAALTAFGLALMQNKAGKGFNVGNMLSEVGAAGEKALPLMEKARQEARAGQLAAGQYALGESKAADAARQKFLVDQSTYLQTRQDKVLDYMQSRRDTLTDDASKRRHDLETEAVKHGFALRKQEIKSQLDAAKDDKYDKIEDYQLLPNIPALKIQRGFDGKKPVYADPGTTSMQVAETYKDVQVKLNMVDDLENIITKLANEGDNAFGGQVGKILFDRINKYSKLVGGPYAKVFNDRGITDESEAQVIIDAFVQANKRFISQETGNGVSDGDKKDIRTVTGEIVLTDSLDKNLARLDQVRSLFSKNVGLLENEIIRLGKRGEYSSDEQFELSQKTISDILNPVDILGSTSFDVRD
jgi:gas vesicle protein